MRPLPSPVVAVGGPALNALSRSAPGSGLGGQAGLAGKWCAGMPAEWGGRGPIPDRSSRTVPVLPNAVTFDQEVRYADLAIAIPRKDPHLQRAPDHFGK